MGEAVAVSGVASDGEVAAVVGDGSCSIRSLISGDASVHAPAGGGSV